MNFALDLSDKLSLYLYIIKALVAITAQQNAIHFYVSENVSETFEPCLMTMRNRKRAIADCRDVMSLATRWFTLAFDLYPILNTKTWIVSSLING